MVPGLLGFLGGTPAGLALAPALQVLTWPFLAVTVLMLARGWWLELSHGGRWTSSWRNRATVVLITATVLSVGLWGLRFAGLLGTSPL